MSDKECYDKAVARGDATFTVVGQDLTAPATICEWIKLNIETAPAAKLYAALDRAITMRSGANRKAAD
jgi:hypothetical protein